MKRKPLFYAYCLLTMATIVAAVILGRRVPWSTQKDVYSVLLQVSAIVFGVMGAWIAILYPRGLSQIFRKTGEVSEQTERVRKLLSAMKWATVIVVVALLMHLLAPLAKGLPLAVQWKEWLRAAGMALSVFMVAAQIWTLILSLLPVDQAEEDLERHVQNADSRSRRTSRAKAEDVDDADAK